MDINMVERLKLAELLPVDCCSLAQTKKRPHEVEAFFVALPVTGSSYE